MLDLKKAKGKANRNVAMRTRLALRREVDSKNGLKNPNIKA